MSADLSAAVEGQPAWLIVDPDGVVDGYLIVSRHTPTIEAAQKRFAAPRRWATEARVGWTVRIGTTDEFDFESAIAACDARIARGESRG